MIALFLTMSLVYSQIITASLPPSAWGPDGQGVANADTPWGVLINLFVFALVIVAVCASLVIVHHRPIGGLIGPRLLVTRHFTRVLTALVVLNLLLMLLPMPDALTPLPHLAFDQWIAFLPFALLGLLIQTGAEEIVFRGYLQSQLAARFAHPLVWMGVPSVLFALLHFAPGAYGENAWLVMLWAGLFALAAADLTARSGTIGPAIALHLINNVSALLIAAPAGSFDGLALWTYPFSADDTAIMQVWMPVDLMVLLCSWLAARLALRA